MKLKKKYKKIGIALGGGGARGMAHIGVLKALDEFNLSPHIISGTSIGGLIGALYAKGESTAELKAHFTKEKKIRRINWKHPGKSLMSLSYLSEALKEAIPIDNFLSLNKELHLCVTNLNLGKSEYISQGKLIQWIMATTAIPILFEAIEINNYIYVDGAALDNLPTNPLHRCDLIIGVDLNAINKTIDLGNNMLEIGLRSFHLAAYLATKRKLSACDIIISPPEIEHFSLLEFDKTEEIVEIGYNYTYELLKNLS